MTTQSILLETALTEYLNFLEGNNRSAATIRGIQQNRDIVAGNHNAYLSHIGPAPSIPDRAVVHQAQ